MRATLALLACALLASAEARAATMVVKNLDPPGEGFNDPTPVTPVGGNPGTTVGQQRLAVFNRAAQLWGAALQGPVPIEIDANFAPLPCTGGFIVLGNARPATFMANIPGVSIDLWLPVALANELAGSDQSPGESEIEATFNGGLAACTNGRQDWYYGFDGQAGDKPDLLSVVLHELGHGLGFTSVMDLATGESKSGRFDPFSSHVFDTTLGQPWTVLTAAQRVTSVRSPRTVVWHGLNVLRQAADILALGAPVLKTTPALPGLTARVAEAEFGPAVAARPASGPLVVGTLSPGTCAFQGSAAGAVVLITQSGCPPIQQAWNAQQAGAVAVLIKDDGNPDPPLTVDVQASHRALFPVTVPVLAVSAADATVLAAAPAGTTVQLTAEAATRVGADVSGRPMLFATNPVAKGSTLSHWEMLERPNLLMEPVQAPDAIHDLRMELALFRDLGWSTTCGNGTMDSG
ncbi:MAG TPA: PA domain-containing protein, partial [Actinomycetota bacterium]|nr:PA domain-containing protein [Actinomycetota bacterium]